MYGRYVGPMKAWKLLAALKSHMARVASGNSGDHIPAIHTHAARRIPHLPRLASFAHALLFKPMLILLLDTAALPSPYDEALLPRPIPPSVPVLALVCELASGVWVLECGVLTSREA